MADILQVNDENFAAVVLASSLPVFVDFWAPWCIPCLAISRAVEEIAPQFAGKIKIVKINVEDAIEVAASYNIRGLPLTATFSGGKLVERKIGEQSKTSLEEMLRRLIS